jgi:hypothetical protein
MHPANESVVCGGVLVTRQHALTTLRCALLTKRLQLAPHRLISLSQNKTNNGILPSLPAVRNASISTFFKRHHQTQSASTDITVSGKWYYMFKLDESTQLWSHSYASTYLEWLKMRHNNVDKEIPPPIQDLNRYLSTLEANSFQTCWVLFTGRDLHVLTLKFLIWIIANFHQKKIV